MVNQNELYMYKSYLIDWIEKKSTLASYDGEYRTSLSERDLEPMSFSEWQQQSHQIASKYIQDMYSTDKLVILS